MIAEFLSRATKDDEGRPVVTPDVLICQGAAAMVFLLAFGVLQGLLWLPLQWRAGEMARLIGLLWVLPAAMLMTARHAALHLSDLPATRYLRRMRYGWLAALLLAVAAFPVAQMYIQDRHLDVSSPILTLPIVLSLILCLLAFVAAQRLGTWWFRLPLQSWEGADGHAGRPAEWPLWRVDRSAIVAGLWRAWFGGALLMAGALIIHQRATDQVGVPQAWGALAFLAYLGLGPLLIGQAARTGRQAQWQVERIAISDEALEGWGTRGLTVSLIALAGAGLALSAGLFGAMHTGMLRLTGLMGLSAPHGPQHVSLAGDGVPPAGSGAGDYPVYGGGTGGAQGHGGWGLSLHIGLPNLSALLLVALAGALVWSLFWARRRESHAVARWLLLAALVERLLAYLGWLGRGFPRPAMLRLRGRDRREKDQPTASRSRRRTDSADPVNPRQAIIAQYLRSLEHAARRGYPRRPGQTPRQHAGDLRAGLRREHDAPAAMADLFTAARFSPEPTAAAEADQMRQLGRAVRRNLRRR